MSLCSHPMQMFNFLISLQNIQGMYSFIKGLTVHLNYAVKDQTIYE